MELPLSIENYQIPVSHCDLETGPGLGRGFLRPATCVVTGIVTLDIEVVEAGLPVSGLALLPIGYIGLNGGPGYVNTLAQLYGSLATQTPSLHFVATMSRRRKGRCLHVLAAATGITLRAEAIRRSKSKFT